MRAYLLDKALSQIDEGLFESAADTSIGLDTDQERLLVVFALLDRDAIDQARAVTARMADAHPALEAIASWLVRSGRYEEGAAEASRIPSCRRNWRVWWILGDCYEHKGWCAEARRAYRAAERTGRPDGRLAFNIGNSYFDEGRFQQAVLEYARAEQLGWVNRSLYLCWALSLERLGEYRRALRLAERASNVSPPCLRTMELVVRCLRACHRKRELARYIAGIDSAKQAEYLRRYVKDLDKREGRCPPRRRP